jgi:hypothetical protein
VLLAFIWQSLKMQLRTNVDEATIRRNVALNLERLYRHYQVSIKKYDEVSLLDLSHSLRLWVDMQDGINQYLAQHHPTRRFTAYTLCTPLLKACHGAKYIIAYFIKGVTTHTDNKALLSFKSIGGMMSFGVRQLAGGTLNVSHFLCLAESRIKYEYEPSTAFAVQESTFKKWLDSEVVRVRFLTDKQKIEEKIISREMLIKRVANHLGGSHPNGVFEVTHKYDKAVEYLLSQRIGNIPLPYYILLKSAHDILDIFDYLRDKCISS